MNTHGIKLFGKNFIVDLNVRGGVRLSPGANARARCLGKHARGKSLADRKALWDDSKCKVKGS
ncbi:hypothetical protein LCGC14_0926590 [marine sediment metagenome]|uniref:Uncharacterized protein n=1 Tax=marine sediment metagenome TaxID=412755 RepID=A0A0F9PA42_9ZZZZ